MPGLAHAPRDATTRDELTRRAELALRAGSQEGAGAHRAFEPAHRRRVRPTAIHPARAAARARAPALEVHYQPIVAADGGAHRRRRGAAALDPPMRGADPAGRLRSGRRADGADGRARRIRAAPRAARRQALARSLHRGQSVAGAGARPRASSTWCARLLAESGVAPSRLMLEVTEGVLIDNPGRDGQAPRGPARARRAHRARRFRLRLFQPELSAAISVRQAQDRPQLRRAARPLGQRRRDHPGDRGARPRARPDACWPKASRPRSSACCCGSPAATRCRATCSPGRRRPRRSTGCWRKPAATLPQAARRPRR